MNTDRMPAPALDLLLAFCLLSRLPLPHLPESAFVNSQRAVWAYPVVGVVLAAIASGGGLLAMKAGLPAGIAAGLTLALLCLLSGAMHEDGLADCADGFWGAQLPESRLAIMKDSQIGTYGTLALFFITGLKWISYAVLLPLSLGPIIATAAMSRAAMPVLMLSLRPARDSGLSSSVGQPTGIAVCAGLAIAAALSILLVGAWALAAIGLVGSVVLLFGLLAARKIGGQTGDVLGATQQLTELAALVVFLEAFA